MPFKSKSVDHSAFDILTPAAAYWVGFLMADGHVGYSTNRVGKVYKHVHLNLARVDHCQIAKFKEFLCSDYAIINQDSVTNYGPKKSTGTVITSTRLFDRLGELGIRPRKTGTETCPPELVHSPDFWRGMIDGDGSVGMQRNRKPGRAAVKSYPTIKLGAPAALIDSFCEFHRALGLPARRRVGRRLKTIDPHHKVQLNGTPAQVLIQALYYPGHPVSLTRKAEAAAACLAWSPAFSQADRRLKSTVFIARLPGLVGSTFSEVCQVFKSITGQSNPRGTCHNRGYGFKDGRLVGEARRYNTRAAA